MMPATSLLFVLTALLTSVPLAPAAPRAVVGLQVDPGPAPEILARAWEADLVSLGEIDKLAPVGPRLLILDRSHGITALDLGQGLPRWFLQLPEPPVTRPFEGAGLIPFVTGTEVVLVNADTGSRVFVGGFADVPTGSPISDGTRLYTPSYVGDRLVVRDLATGLVNWSLGLPGILQGPAQLSDVGLVIYACHDGTVRAAHTTRSGTTGEAWMSRTGGVVGRPVLDRDRVYVASDDPAVYALDGSSGEVVWKSLPGEQPTGMPVVAAGVVTVSTRSGLIGLSAADGHALWRGPAGETPIGVVGGLLVTRAADGSSLLRDQTTGELLAAGLSAFLFPCGDVLVERAGPTLLRGWKVR